MRSDRLFAAGSLLAGCAVIVLLLWTSRTGSGPEQPSLKVTESRTADVNTASPSIDRQAVPRRDEHAGGTPAWNSDELGFLEMARNDDRFSVVTVEILDSARGPLAEVLGASMIELRVLTDDRANHLTKDATLMLGRSSARRFGVTTPRRTLSEGDVRTVVVQHAVILGFHKGCALLLEGPALSP